MELEDVLPELLHVDHSVAEGGTAEERQSNLERATSQLGHHQPICCFASKKRCAEYSNPPRRAASPRHAAAAAAGRVVRAASPADAQRGLVHRPALRPDAPWRNFPVTPDAGYYNFANLATLPTALPIAQHHVPGGGLRPGNNTPLLPPDFASSRIQELNAVCIPDARLATAAADALKLDPDAARGYAGGYAYL
jgi:hypothetical protein